MLAPASASLSPTPRLDLRPVRGAEPVRAPAAERRERAEAWNAPETAVPARTAAAAYGRAASRIGPDFAGQAAFLAQLIAQQESESPEAPPQARREEGLAAYRRVVGDDLIVVGPAGAVGLLL